METKNPQVLQYDAAISELRSIKMYELTQSFFSQHGMKVAWLRATV